MPGYKSIEQVQSKSSMAPVCILASVALLGAGMTVMASAGTGQTQLYAPTMGRAVQTPVMTASVPTSLRTQAAAIPSEQFSGVFATAGQAVPAEEAFPQYTQAPAQAGPINSTAMLALAAAFAAALGVSLSRWYSKAKNVTLLEPLNVTLVNEDRIAMAYSTGRRTDTGRQSTKMYGLLDRVSRLVRSNVTSVVKKMEDPEKIIEQAVTDMQGDLIKIRQTYSEVLASQKRTELKQKQAQENAESWGKRAMLALEKGDEDLAREALKRKTAEQKALDGLNAQLQQSQPIVDNLLNSMKQLEAKLDEAKANKAQLIARAKSAETSKKVNDMLTGMDQGSAMAAFDRMEEKVENLESYAQVSGEIAGSTMESKFAALESGDSVDDELAKMKRQLSGGDDKAALPPAPKSAEDLELEKMRQQLKGK